MTKNKKMEWKHDKDLEDNLNKYVRENLQRNEILDFMQRDSGIIHGV